MEFRCRNVNEAFTTLVETVHHHLTDEPTQPISLLEEETRNGLVYSFEDPVVITYHNPLERVLFNTGRDCNPFFHLVESLWMLAGRNDIATVSFFNEQMAEYSDDGFTQHAAYGHRWRNAWSADLFDHDPYDTTIYQPTRATPPDHKWSLEDPFTNAGDMFTVPFDQLQIIIDELKRDPKTRRLCLSMWQLADLALLKIRPQCKDLPCNTHAHFRVIDGYLNMTVYNRSNDMIWGTFGANAVHFSFLLEYIALSAGLKVGCYHQVTNNLHIYKNKWMPERWLKSTPDYYHSQNHISLPDTSYVREDGKTQVLMNGRVDLPYVGGSPPLLTEQSTFDKEVAEFITACTSVTDLLDTVNKGRSENFPDLFRSVFLSRVAVPMVLAFHYHKQRNYLKAHTAMSYCTAEDWREAGRAWLCRRERLWKAKQGV